LIFLLYLWYILTPMEVLYILIGALVALFIILSLLNNYKKYKKEMEAKLDTIKLFIGSIKDNLEHSHKIAMDLIQLNKLEMEKLKQLFENQSSAVEQRMEEFRQTITEQMGQLNEFRQKQQKDFTAFQQMINPQFLQSNKSASDLAVILKFQVQQTVNELASQLNIAKTELEKVQAFQLLRMKDTKEQQVSEQQNRVNELEKKLAQFQKQLDSLNHITDFSDSLEDTREYELGEV
jgi:hypothetical protein